MLQHILSNKGVLAGAIFCVLIVTDSLLYSWHVERGIREDEARTKRFLQQLETNKAVRTTQQAEETDISVVGQPRAPVATENGSEPMSKETDSSPTDDMNSVDTAAERFPDAAASEDIAADMLVSPHGFGPYPEVPEDFPGAEHFSWDTFYDESPTQELMLRTRIKLWNQGIPVTGIVSKSNGLLYPIVRGTIYVKWSRNGDYITSVTSHPDDMDRIDRFNGDLFGLSTLDDIPSDIKVLDFNEGIDPYQFLNLQR